MKFAEVKPRANLFAELGRNTYDYVELLSELIDDAIAARLTNPSQRKSFLNSACQIRL
jgi:hypothetical protein